MTTSDCRAMGEPEIHQAHTRGFFAAFIYDNFYFTSAISISLPRIHFPQGVATLTTHAPQSSLLDPGIEGFVEASPGSPRG